MERIRVRTALGVTLAVAASAVIVAVTEPSVGAAPTNDHLEVEMLDDVDVSEFGSDPEGFFSLGDQVLFVAKDGIHGGELWSFDRVTETTSLVKDINPGPPRSLTSMSGAVVDGRFYFRADDGVHDFELWVTDGTAEGTHLVHDINASGRSLPTEITPYDDGVVFGADDGVVGDELWYSDGTTTVLLADIDPTGDSDPNRFVTIEYRDGTEALYFTADGPNGRELYRYDEEDGLTEFDLEAGSVGSDPEYLTVVAETLYFGAGPGDEQLYRLSGATAGSVNVTALATSGRVVDVERAGSKLFIRTMEGIDDDLFVVDGSTASPSLILDDADFQSLTGVSTGVVFRGKDAMGSELWFSDGTVSGTARFTDLEPGAGSSSASGYTTSGDGTSILFRATTTEHGRRWYITDGSAGGTTPLTSSPTDPGYHARATGSSEWFFSTSDGSGGYEPWRTDGTAGDTAQVANINQANESSDPSDFVRLGNRIVFSADDGVIGDELFATDLESGVTTNVVDIDPNGSSGPHSLTVLDELLIFVATTDDHGQELWVSDGTALGTALVVDLTPGPDSTSFACCGDLVRVGDFVFFATNDDHLWRTDGTAAGTVQLTVEPVVRGDFNLGAGGILFEVDDPATGGEPWYSNGVETMMLADTVPGSDDDTVDINDSNDPIAYFVAADDVWETDGTPAGTNALAVPLPSSSEVSAVAFVGGVMWIEADDDVVGDYRYFRSDDLGQTLTDVDLSAVGSSAYIDTDDIYLFDGRFVSMNDEIIFFIDGTTATPLALDPGHDFDIDSLRVVRDHLFFEMENSDDSNAPETVWVSDGTTAGTRKLFSSESESSSNRRISHMTAIADRFLVFGGSTYETGDEPFFVDTAVAPFEPAGVVATAGVESAEVFWTAGADGGDADVAFTVTASPGGATCVPTGTTCVVGGLEGGTSYTFTVVASNSRGASPPSASSNAVVPSAAPVDPDPDPVGPEVVSLTPGRVFASRASDETVDGLFEGEGRIAAGDFVEVDIAGRAGVDEDAKSVVMNITAINPSGRGFITTFPCETRPLASSLNFGAAGAVVGNELVAKLSGDGTVCVFTSAETDLTIDVVGFVPAGSEIVSLDPGRVYATRASDETVDGEQQKVGRLSPGVIAGIVVAGRVGVPSTGAGSVVMNVTAINPSGRGFITAFPCGDRPLASSLNFGAAGAVVGNELIAKLSGDGKVCVYSSAATDLTVDVVGYVPTSSAATSLDPARVYATRMSDETVDGLQEATGQIPAGEFVEVEIAGRAGVPSSDVGAVVMNITAINPTGRGYITTYPCETRPLASSLNYGAAGAVVGNELVAKLSATGTMCVYTSAATDLTVDVVGYIPT